MAITDGNLQTGFKLVEAAAPLSRTANTAAADSTGVITAQFEVVPYDFYWMVEIIAVSTNSTTGTKAYVYVDTPLTVDNIISTSTQGNLDQDDRNNQILIEPTKRMTVKWTGASLGSQGTVRIQYKAKILIPGNE